MKLARERARLSLEELAAQVEGVGADDLRSVEEGRRAISMSSMLYVQEVLGIRLRFSGLGFEAVERKGERR